MALKPAIKKDAVTAVENASACVLLTLLYVLSKQSKKSLPLSAVINDHAMAVNRALTKHLRACLVVASIPDFTNDASVAVEFKIYGVQGAQADFDSNKLAESVRRFVDLVELTTACVAVGAEAAKRVEEGMATAPQMYLAREPQDAFAILDENFNVRVMQSPVPHLNRLKKVLSAAGALTSSDIDVQYTLDGKVTQSPAIPIDATKVHRYADSTRSVMVPVSGYLRRSRIVEVELEGKNLQLEVPEDYSSMVEQAAKADAWVRMTVEVYKSTNPCLADEPHLKIVSIEEILGQAKLKLAV